MVMKPKYVMAGAAGATVSAMSALRPVAYAMSARPPMPHQQNEIILNKKQRQIRKM
jgi:uncharacterized membrane protein YcjF (UPF0283 family)